VGIVRFALRFPHTFYVVAALRGACARRSGRRAAHPASSPSSNMVVPQGLLEGNPGQVVNQVIGICMSASLRGLESRP